MAGLLDLPQCRDCVTASAVLRRLGFRDTITWGPVFGSPSETQHAWHSNAGGYTTRVETEVEFKRRVQSHRMMGLAEEKLLPEGQSLTEYAKHPLCSHYRGELAWLSAGRPTRTTVYLAHPVAGDFERNVANATAWFRYLRGLLTHELSELVGHQFERKPLILCPWLAGIQPDEESPGGRESMLIDCRDTVMMFDEVWLLSRVTPGMSFESTVARVTRNLTHLGESPPSGKVFCISCGLEIPRGRTRCRFCQEVST